MTYQNKQISSANKIRVAIVVSHPIQHHVHLYRALAQVPEIDLKVFLPLT